MGAFRDFLEKAGKVAYLWDALDGRWARANSAAVFPGQLLWIPTDEGGYSRNLGWDPRVPWDEGLKSYVPPEEYDASSLWTSEPEYDSDLLSQFGWQSIAKHTNEVVAELGEIERRVKLSGIPWKALRLALRWHDWGKAHSVFQNAIKEESETDGKRPNDWIGKRDIAKAKPSGFWRRYDRKHFRHELASAIGILALLRDDEPPPEWSDLSRLMQNLALYLIASHHGKVRLSIRSMPHERKPISREARFARGIWDGDQLPAISLGDGAVAPEVTLDLSPMQLGESSNGSPSWAQRMLGLRDHPDVGPLRLAFLEAAVRAADMRASKSADEKARR